MSLNRDDNFESVCSSIDNLEAPSSHHRFTVIWAHGFGQTGSVWLDVIKTLQQDPRLRDFRFLVPTASEMRVTLWEQEGRVINAWFDIPTWNDISTNINDESGMIRAREWFSQAIDEEIAKGVDASNIFLGGFSQGGCIALFTGLTGRHTLGGVFALSAYLPMMDRVTEIVADRIPDLSRKQMPILMAHGNGDPKVKWNWGHRSQEAISKMGFDVDFRTYRGLFHNINQTELDDLVGWLAQPSTKPTAGP